MNAPHRVTQLDVAQKVGVARSTVSLALRNHPSIPKATREQIRRIADELGYEPDPMLSALASYRSRKGPSHYHGTLAWIVNNEPPFQWDKVSMFQQYYQGSKERARAHGYQIETFDIANIGASASSLSRTFHFRNISGILLPPQPRPNMELEFPWERFAMVSFGYSLTKPRLHVVAPTQFRAATETMQRLHAAGYRKIGFVHSKVTDTRSDHNFLAGYLVECHLHGGTTLVLDEDNIDATTFRKWYKKYKPDAVVSGNPRLLEIIAKAGYQVPADIGVACLNVPSQNSELTGIMEDSFHIGEAAVDFLVGMLQQGVCGIPPKPRQILVPGIWISGTTIASQAVVA
jgi:DNA-binding LacI/PurR family transcriptional regulator